MKGLKNNYTGLLIALMISSFSTLSAQRPNCSPGVNPGFAMDGTISVQPDALIDNLRGQNRADRPLTVSIFDHHGSKILDQVVGPGTINTPISFSACNYRGQTLKVTVTNGDGNCWSELNIKQNVGPPMLMGRSDTIWCTDPAVDDNVPWELYADTTFDSRTPIAIVPCMGPVASSFVADWIDPNDTCGQDVAKVIYREYEAFDKDGNRGSTFDTITVYRLPEIAMENSECPEVDTMYCGVTAFPRPGGGYYTGPRLYKYNPNTMECDTLWFCYVEDDNEDGWLQDTEWKTTGDLNSTKCGLAFKKKVHKFEDSCSPVYKIELEIKQLCAGATGEAGCPAPTGNPIELVDPARPGYYSCTWWVYDLDTLVPEVDCHIDEFQTRAFTDPDCSGDFVRTIVVPAGAHECAAHTYLPPAIVSDDWSGVKTVKARFNGATYVFEPDNPSATDQPYGPSLDTFRHHSPVFIPKAEWPEMIIYEAYDNCHLVAMDTCYVIVKDRTNPTAVVDKGITVSIPDKKVWVNAESFDEGSWDNCGDPRIFVRRSDWYTSCVDLCTNVVDDQCGELLPDTESSLEFCEVGEHKDTLWYARLEEDKHCNEVEAHYSKSMEWLCHDGTACGELLYNAWTYDLIKYGTLECGKMTYLDEKSLDKAIRETLMLKLSPDVVFTGDLNADLTSFLDGLRLGKFKIDLPHLHECSYFGPDDSAFDRLINAVVDLINLGLMDFSEPEVEELFGILNRSIDPEPGRGEFFLDMFITTYQQWFLRELDTYGQIGGGWSDQVPFDCSDACQSVTVEVLAIDYWCNWSKGWTDVWVEDKTPVQVVKDVTTDFEISCKTYKDQGIDLLVNSAVGGDTDAMAALDTIFGGYQKAWRDAHGNYVDGEGVELDCDLIYSDSSCFCDPDTAQIRVEDDHLGLVWKDSIFSTCGYMDNPIPLTHGAVVVNCAENVFCAQTVWADFKECGVGSIHRTFKIWQECVEEGDVSRRSLSSDEVDTIFRHQTIWVGNECDLELGMFNLPEDMVVEQCGVVYDPELSGNVAGAAHPDSTGRLVYDFDDDCRVVGVGYYDKVFKIVGGDEGCYKILRTWCYSDWCEGKPASENWWEDPDYASDINKYVQKIIIVDPTPPVVTIEPVVDGAARGSCAFNLSTQATVSDACGLIQFAFEIISNDNQEVVASGQGEIDGSDSTTFMIDPDVAIPPGDFTVQALVRDECQNEMVASTPLTVTSDKKPGMVCVTSLTAELTPIDTGGTVGVDEGCAIVWADEYRSSIVPACSDDSVSLFIERIDGLSDDTLDPEDADSIKFTCSDYDPSAPIMLRLWAVSLPSGSMDYCDIMLNLQNNMEACILSRSDVSGIIQNELEHSVEDVDVKGSLANGQSLSFLTTSSGAYRIANALGIEMNIAPTKNSEHLNGISTADLIKIQKHILGKDLIESDYRKIAADANADDQINALDLIALRKLILGVTPELENSDSWRFVNMIDGSPTYEVQGDKAMSVDFMGIKVGDVNLDSDPGRSMARSSESLTFTVVDRELEAGEVAQVALYGGDLAAYEGFQMTAALASDQVNLLDVTGSEILGVSKEHFGLQKMEEGKASVSWNRVVHGDTEIGLPVVTLLVEAKVAVKLSDVLAVNSSLTSAEAYVNDVVHGVALKFVEGTDDSRFALLQNQPNPFASETNIGFHLPEALAGSLTVYDVTGKVLMQKDGDFTQGYNQVSLTRAQLSKATGVLYYQLDTEEHTATRKMILLD